MAEDGESIPVVGIDLGTTNTCAGVWKNGSVQIIPNSSGGRTTPSVVCFTDDGIEYVGETAKDNAHLHPGNIIHDVKRIIGTPFEEPDIQASFKNWPFKVVSDSGKSKVRVNVKGENVDYSPETISSKVLAEIKRIADDYYGSPITQAVITVPAYFSNGQREATKAAARIAGLEVLSMINEPTAAALAFGWENKKNSKRTVLVYDLGGGTFDVSILEIHDRKFTVKATSGDTHLGGSNFDENLMNYLADCFKAKFCKDLRDNNVALSRLRVNCENVKKKLSSQMSAEVDLLALHDKKDLTTEITRVKFEALNMPLFLKTIKIVEQCLKDAKLKKDHINEIVLVGGSTRIPWIQAELKRVFIGKEVLKSVNPDEAVAIGATLRAASLAGGKYRGQPIMKINDVTPMTIGMGSNKDIDKIIAKNTPIPVKVKKIYSTSFDLQTSARFPIYEIKNEANNEINLLGTFYIRGLPEKPKGKVKFEVKFTVDHDGVLNVETESKKTGQKGGITVGLDSITGMSEKEITDLIRSREAVTRAKTENESLEQAKYELTSYCQNTKVRAQEELNLDPETCEEIVRMCDGGLELQETSNNVDEIQQTFQKLKAYFDSEGFFKDVSDD